MLLESRQRHFPVYASGRLNFLCMQMDTRQNRFVHHSAAREIPKTTWIGEMHDSVRHNTFLEV